MNGKKEDFIIQYHIFYNTIYSIVKKSKYIIWQHASTPNSKPSHKD